ncbi:UNVERIFIED_CONTAM: Transcriptional regulator of ribosomal biogenesis proteins [Siphonaria sp. JEL0065]|nr:Transcriptional regulator of ribosomal biogenesis proteins [Siphonaria sp. JEL0065]
MAMALYSRSPLLASSPSRDLEHVAGLTDQFCKDFVCCGINMENLHDLLQHFEEYHVSVNDDVDSDSDPDDFPDQNDTRQPSGGSSIWNAYGRSRNFSSFDDKDNGSTDDYGGHLPFAFESHVSGPTSETPLSYSAVAALPPSSILSGSFSIPTPRTKPGTSQPNNSIPNSLTFASRGARSFLSSTSSASNSNDILSTSLQALSVSGPDGGSNSSGASLSLIKGAIPSPSNSTHSTTPPPLHHELSATAAAVSGSNSSGSPRSGFLEFEIGSSSATNAKPRQQLQNTTNAEKVGSPMEVTYAAVAAAGVDPSRRGSRGQIRLKRKVGDDRMEVDDLLMLGGGNAAGVNTPFHHQQPMRIDSTMSMISDTDSVSNKKRFVMEGDDESNDTEQFVVDDHEYVDEDTSASTSWAAAAIGADMGGSAGGVLSHFRKRSLLSSASFSPLAAPETDEVTMAALFAASQHPTTTPATSPQNAKFGEMSAEEIEAFQQMTTDQQQEFVMSNLDPSQIAMLMMMVNQASLTDGATGSPSQLPTVLADTPALEIPPVLTEEEEAASAAAAAAAATAAAEKAATAALVKAVISTKGGRGKPKATHKLTLKQQQKDQLSQERTPSASVGGSPAAVNAKANTNDSPTSTPAATGADGEEPQDDNDSDRPFKCHLCEKTYKNPGGIKYHLKHTHGIEHISFSDMSDADRPYLCTVEGCGKRYKNLNGLKVNSQSYEVVDHVS